MRKKQPQELAEKQNFTQGLDGWANGLKSLEVNHRKKLIKNGLKNDSPQKWEAFALKSLEKKRYKRGGFVCLVFCLFNLNNSTNNWGFNKRPSTWPKVKEWVSVSVLIESKMVLIHQTKN